MKIVEPLQMNAYDPAASPNAYDPASPTEKRQGLSPSCLAPVRSKVFIGLYSHLLPECIGA